jgi:branched-chain amino acid transport system permease protein
MTQLEVAARPRRLALGRSSWQVICALVGLLVLVSLPLLISRADVLILLFLVFLGITLSQSWNVLGGFAGQVNLGHAAFFGIGALVARSTWIGGWPYALSFLIGGLVALAFAMLIGVPTFRLRGTYFAIGTLGLAEVLRITSANALPAVSSLPPAFVAAYDLTLRYELALALAAACIAASAWLLRSRVGLGMLAVREDEQAAQATGVGALRHKIVALAISSLFAGLAGCLFAFYHVSYYPELPFEATWTFDAVLPVYVGGIGTLWGPVVGAALYVLVRQQLEISLPQAHQIIFGLLFILVVLMFPGGLVEAVRTAAHSPRLAGLRLAKKPLTRG